MRHRVGTVLAGPSQPPWIGPRAGPGLVPRRGRGGYSSQPHPRRCARMDAREGRCRRTAAYPAPDFQNITPGDISILRRQPTVEPNRARQSRPMPRRTTPASARPTLAVEVRTYLCDVSMIDPCKSTG